MPLAGKMSFHILLLVFQMRDGMIALDNACGETSNRATPVWYSFSLEYANRQIAFQEFQIWNSCVAEGNRGKVMATRKGEP
jgi:hypothetical protein